MSRSEPKIPDGGWGWAVVMGATIIHFLVVGTGRSFGVYYLQFRDRFQQSSAATAWVVAIFNTVRMAFGPLVGILCERFTTKYVAIIGGFLIAIGVSITAFANSLTYAYFSFGAVAGFGASLLFTPCYIIVGKYFERNKGKAMAISTMGSGFGLVALAPMTQMLLDTYSFFGAMLIMGAFMLHNVFSALLFRPLPKPAKVVELQHNNEGSLFETKIKPPYKHSGWYMVKRQLSVLGNFTFLLYGLQMLCMSIALNAFWSFLPAIAEQHGADRKAAALLLSVMGGADMAGRFLWGFLFDMKAIRFRRRLCHTLIGFPLSAIVILTGLLSSYWAFFSITIAFGLLEGGFHGQRATIVSEFVAKDQMSSTVGFVIFFQGVGIMAGPPVAGMLQDIYKTYNVCYFFGGSTLLLSSTVFLMEYFIRKMLGKRHSDSSCI